ncbi:PREDICTED: non-specific lipid-transfer protein-like protein At2g13820 [Nelumbo nucifera]|uniref:Non-specific lipid-transfer protein-like protein At2g13820 n=2 Tax=Nelumbo nucifera TaxID=4432 RepID=A0A1U7ZVC0_NELNU|nr:PREDICTED: non-specific lipid-transfer protein-like protein At2g13820 [Nelumbo nucifera]DAD19592.1 TPA_asm: hypothetical protein HUJ06_021055 [Nelumbo nucifera]
MEARGMGVGLLALVVAMHWEGAATQSSRCMSVIVSMSPCLNYITGNSPTLPSSSCCSQLANVVQSTPQCLCEVLNGGASSLGIVINQTQALTLPNACNIQTPPVSLCNASPAGTPDSNTIPVAPAATPDANSTPEVPAGTPAVPSIPSGGGSKTVPSTSGNTSEGSSTTKLTFSMLFFIFFSASYASTFTSF